MTFTDLCTSLWTLSALRVAAETDLLATLADGPKDAKLAAIAAGLETEATSRILDVLVASGIVTRSGDRYALEEEGRKLAARGQGLRSDLAVTFGATRALYEEARRSDLAPGWRHVDPEVIRGQAGLSFEMTHRIIGPITEAWPELAAHLARDDARHLDVGVGGAGGAIALCKHFPKLRITGIDCLRAAYLEARTAVASAGLPNRIELRLQRAEDMPDENVFHSAFVASKFFERSVLKSILANVRRALVPGGIAFLPGWRDPGDPKRRAVSRLREHLWGGSAVPGEEVVKILEELGYVEITQAPGQGDVLPIMAKTPSQYAR